MPSDVGVGGLSGDAPRTVVFLSDYATSEEFVGVCHLVIARLAAGVRVIDLAHGVPGIRAGAAVLESASAYLPDDAVVLAVVDPGVGTSRRGIAVRAASGSWMVGPDNGLLVPLLEALGGAVQARVISRFEAASATFHGRDVFAPAAAHLALRRDESMIGPSMDAATLVRLPPPRVVVSRGRLESDVVRTDHFGNLRLAATGADLRASGLAGAVSVNGEPAVVGRTFGDAPHGGLLVYEDSAGRAAVAVNGGSAAERLHPAAGVVVTAGP